MTASVTFLTVLVSVALALVAAAALILVGLWIRDFFKGELW